jgi:cyclopropane fatty-acyl-phospholipid synthase-like methyltransferase
VSLEIIFFAGFQVITSPQSVEDGLPPAGAGIESMQQPDSSEIDVTDPKKLVAAGYDEIVDSYQRQFGHSAVRARKLAELELGLSPQARVLDLGCGAGLPVARDLIAHGYRVTGVDASARQIEQARRNVPDAQFILGEMTAVEFPPSSFEAIGAFYSIFHVPRQEHATLLRYIAHWLTSRGRFLGTFGTTALDGWTGEWLGTNMFFSHHDSEVTKQLVVDAGLFIERAEVLQQDDEDACFFWITARKP